MDATEGSSYTLWIEYRQPVGVDESLGAPIFSVNTRGIIVTSASNLIDLNPYRPEGTGEAVVNWQTEYTETPDPLWASLNANKSWSPPASGMTISNIQLQGDNGVDGVCFQVAMAGDDGLSNDLCAAAGAPATPAPQPSAPPTPAPVACDGVCTVSRGSRVVAP